MHVSFTYNRKTIKNFFYTREIFFQNIFKTVTHMGLFSAHAGLTQAHYILGQTHTKSSQVNNNLWCIQLNHRSFSSKILIFWIWHEKASRGHEHQHMVYSNILQLSHALRVSKTLLLCTSWAKLPQWFGMPLQKLLFLCYTLYSAWFFEKNTQLWKKLTILINSQWTKL